MEKDNEKYEQHPQTKGNEGARQPDPETLGTTDPQEHMKGPISSFMQGIKDGTKKTSAKAGDDKEDVFMPQKEKDKLEEKKDHPGIIP